METSIEDMSTRDDHPVLNGKALPADLPTTPDEIDLERVVDDPEYRRAVKDLLRRWGFGETEH